MPMSLADLEKQRSQLGMQISRLNDLRPGSVTDNGASLRQADLSLLSTGRSGSRPDPALDSQGAWQDRQRSSAYAGGGEKGRAGNR